MKFYFLAFFLNLIGYFVLSVLAPSAGQMGMTGLMLAYYVFGFTLILAIDILVWKRFISWVKGK